jgi:hypothetical protein
LNDVVEYQGSSWICVQAHTNQTPADNAYWDLMTQGDSNTYLQNVVEDTTPQLGGPLDAQNNPIYFGTETTNTPVGTTQTVDLTLKNHQTLDLGSASGDVTATLTVPSGSSAGTLIVAQGATARDVTWTPSSGTIKWMGTEPTWNADANLYRIVAWRWNGSILFLQASEAA